MYYLFGRSRGPRQGRGLAAFEILADGLTKEPAGLHQPAAGQRQRKGSVDKRSSHWTDEQASCNLHRQVGGPAYRKSHARICSAEQQQKQNCHARQGRRVNNTGRQKVELALPSGYDKVLADAWNALMHSLHGNGSGERVPPHPPPAPARPARPAASRRAAGSRCGAASRSGRPRPSRPRSFSGRRPNERPLGLYRPNRPWTYTRQRRERPKRGPRTWTFDQANVTAWNSVLRWLSSLFEGE